MISIITSYIGLGFFVFGLIVIWKSLPLGLIAIIIGMVVFLSHIIIVSKRRYIATSTDTPLETLQKLALDKYSGVRGGVVFNPNTPLEIFQKLALDTDPDVRIQVASSPNTPTETFQKFAHDEDPNLRLNVASNPYIPTETLQKLALDEDKLVRCEVASNPNTPTETLHKLALGRESDGVAFEEALCVLDAVALNPNTPTETLQKLALDTSPYVRLKAVSNPNYESPNFFAKSQEALISQFESLKKEKFNASTYRIDCVTTLFPEDGALMLGVSTFDIEFGNLDITVLLQPDTDANLSGAWLINLSMHPTDTYTKPVAVPYRKLIEYFDKYIVLTEGCIKSYIKLHNDLLELKCNSNDEWIAYNYLQVFQYLKRNNRIWDVECIDVVSNEISCLKYKMKWLF